jgi:hypothetical protein
MAARGRACFDGLGRVRVLEEAEAISGGHRGGDALA